MSKYNYRRATEIKMKSLFDSLSEKDRRRYAAVEADKLGHGGVDYISRLFQIDSKTIHSGMIDLSDENALQQQGERKKRAAEKIK